MQAVHQTIVINGIAVEVNCLKKTIKIDKPLTGNDLEVAQKINAICRDVVLWLDGHPPAARSFVSIEGKGLFAFPPVEARSPFNPAEYHKFSVIYSRQDEE